MKKAKTKKKVIAKKKASAPKLQPVKKEKPIGEVTHFYGHISVAVIKWKKPIKIGVKIRFGGATTDFSQDLKSMQYDHKDIKSAKKGQAVGVKTREKVRAGDSVYSV